jgi:hypothetical protein
MSKNIMIPLSLLDKIIDLLAHWDVSGCDCFMRSDYHDVLGALAWKKQKLELRDAYVNIIKAPDQDGRDIARIEYLRQRRLVMDDIPF